MKITMAVILTAENQYSISPKTLTLRALTRISPAENVMTHHQPGTSGNHKRM